MYWQCILHSTNNPQKIWDIDLEELGRKTQRIDGPGSRTKIADEHRKYRNNRNIFVKGNSGNIASFKIMKNIVIEQECKYICENTSKSV